MDSITRLIALIGCCAVVSCGGDGEVVVPQEKNWSSRIDEARAFADLEAFAAIGGMNHVQGNRDGIERGRAMIVERLRAAGFLDDRVQFQEFAQKVPTDSTGSKTRTTVMKNIVAVLPGARPEVIAIGCHYDTKILNNFVGANDGCSGIALTLELARQLAAETTTRPFTYYFVFFDGEEAFFDWRLEHDGGTDNCYGSRAMAADKERFPIETLVLLDMVGDADLELNFEVNSHKELRAQFVEASNDVFGIDVFGPTVAILDDHMPFKLAGMTRVIDLIDFKYGPNNSWWHTEKDVVAHCSADSLKRVGTLVMATLPRIEEWLPGKLAK